MDQDGSYPTARARRGSASHRSPVARSAQQRVSLSVVAKHDAQPWCRCMTDPAAKHHTATAICRQSAVIRNWHMGSRDDRQSAQHEQHWVGALTSPWFLSNRPLMRLACTACSTNAYVNMFTSAALAAAVSLPGYKCAELLQRQYSFAARSRLCICRTTCQASAFQITRPQKCHCVALPPRRRFLAAPPS
jgi:hypothetical protein